MKILNFIFGNNNPEDIGKKLSNILINRTRIYKIWTSLINRPDTWKKTCDELKVLQGDPNLSQFYCKKIIHDENENFLLNFLFSTKTQLQVHL